MRLDIYVNYNGTCEEAFRFYEQNLGGKITMMMRHGEQPNAPEVPENQKNKILHAGMELGNAVLMGADIPPDVVQPMRSAYLTLTLESDEEADRVYGLLSDGGEIFMEIQQTFFASRFAMLRDKFGTSWMLMH